MAQAILFFWNGEARGRGTDNPLSCRLPMSDGKPVKGVSGEGTAKDARHYGRDIGRNHSVVSPFPVSDGFMA